MHIFCEDKRQIHRIVLKNSMKSVKLSLKIIKKITKIRRVLINTMHNDNI